MSQLRKHLKFTLAVKIRVLWHSFRLGKIGKSVFIDANVQFLRYPKNISVDDEVVIKEGARICSCNEKAEILIGKRTTIGFNTFIYSSDKIEIGNDCLIAPFVYIVDSDHKAAKGQKINVQGNTTAPIRIEDDVWIASNVTILKGVTIGEGAIVAANSVVNKDIAPYEIWGGTPAKKIGNRE